MMPYPNMSMLQVMTTASKEASAARMRLVEPLMFGRLRMDTQMKLPMRPITPIRFRPTPC